MKDSRKALLVSTLIILAAMFGFAYLRDSRRPAPTTTPETTSEKQVISPYADWTIFHNGYALPLPTDWRNTSDTGGTAVLEPGTTKVGSIQKISVTRLSDAKAPAAQQFTTQKEFDEWRAVEGEVQGPMQKLANITVDGEPGLELLDIRGEENEWTMIVWVRKDDVNLYLTFQGNAKFSEDDMYAIDHIATEFRFVAL